MPYTSRDVTRARATIRARGRTQQCWRCGGWIDLDVDTWTVGHLLARIDGGGHGPGNIAVEHPHCNYSAGGKDGHRRHRAAQRQGQRLRVW